MSDEVERTDAAGAPAASRLVAWSRDILQGLLILCVVGWVIVAVYNTKVATPAEFEDAVHKHAGRGIVRLHVYVPRLKGYRFDALRLPSIEQK